MKTWLVWYQELEGSGPHRYDVSGIFSCEEKAQNFIDKQCKKMYKGEYVYERLNFFIETWDVDHES